MGRDFNHIITYFFTPSPPTKIEKFFLKIFYVQITSRQNMIQIKNKLFLFSLDFTNSIWWLQNQKRLAIRQKCSIRIIFLPCTNVGE